jgi:hypothetical protein
LSKRHPCPFAAKCLAAVGAVLLLARCGGSTQPSATTPSVFSIDPAHGSAIGGTAVRITGDHFVLGAVVVVGGVPATDVVVESATSIAAKTGPRAAGSADVTVTVAGRSGTLAGAFTYDADAPPVISSITARGTRPNEPQNFADLNEEIAVTAVVEDPETPADRLTFEWTAEAGTFSGSGVTVLWRAPADAPTPASVVLTLTVSDPGSNHVSATATVSVHNSRKEIGDLAREFLLDFSDSKKPAAFVVRNFTKSPRCEPERDQELSEIDENRTLYRIDSSSIGAPTVNFQFGGFPCSYMPRAGDACAAVPASWQSTCLVTNSLCTAGEKPQTSGTDFVTAVYEQSQWRLCASYYQARGPARPNFIR